MKNSKLFKSFFSLIASLVLFFALSFNLFSQEIPNGDGDLLWERGLNGRSVNDAKFHPINGNIIAAVNHEIWEIDPKDGHTIRIFEGETGVQVYGFIDISNDGNFILLSNAGATGLKEWDYNSGKLIKELPVIPANTVSIYPNTNNVLINIAGRLSIYDFIEGKLIKEAITFYNPSFIRLSKDGKYAAIGFWKKIDNEIRTSMELWDAETLTKIKDFGSPGDINEFRDVQISDDNQYVGYTTGGGGSNLFIFNSNSNLPLKKFINTHSFIFSPESKKILISSDSIAELNFLNLYTMDTVYQYKKLGGDFCINKNNEVFSIGFDYSIYSKMQFFSNRWYTVGINEPNEIIIGILSTKYFNNNIQIATQGIEIINSLMITDTLGKKIYVQNEIPVLNNSTEFRFFLPTGNYLLKLISNGKEYTSKFVVVR